MKHSITLALLCALVGVAAPPTPFFAQSTDGLAGQPVRLVPGARYTLWGVNLGTAGVTVTVNNVTQALPSGQVNHPNRVDFYVPGSTTGTTASVRVTKNGLAGPNVTFPLSQAAAPTVYACVPGVPYLYQGSYIVGNCAANADVRASSGLILGVRVNAVKAYTGQAPPYLQCAATVTVGGKPGTAVSCTPVYPNGQGPYSSVYWDVKWTMPAGLTYSRHTLKVVVDGKTITDKTFISWTP